MPQGKDNAWLITGSAGYIGAHVASALSNLEIPHIMFDNDVMKIASRKIDKSHTVVGDIRKPEDLDKIFAKHNFIGVIHLAALKSVEESQKFPTLYEETNVQGTANILRAMEKNGVKNLIFASTAAIYSGDNANHVLETSTVNPISNYGKSKINAELMIAAASTKFRLNYLNLRYFNVAGAKNKILKDESKDNLVPIVINKIQNDISPVIFGNDYETPDGTAIRDYIHVIDLVDAHLLAIKYLINGGKSQTLNIGSGKGTSVLEIISEILNQSKSDLKPIFAARREGDVGALVADTTAAEEIIGFKAQLKISEIISSAL